MTGYLRMMDTMLDHIERHLGDRLTVEDLAAACGYSAFHFGRMFRACLGISVKQYVLSRKLETARQSLLRPGRRVIDVAMELGFESPEVFSRAFRRMYGVPPSAGERLGALSSRTARARIVERDLSNWRGSIGLDGEVEALGQLDLHGLHASVDVSHRGWERGLAEQVGPFISSEAAELGLDGAKLFDPMLGRTGWQSVRHLSRSASLGSTTASRSGRASPAGPFVRCVRLPGRAGEHSRNRRGRPVSVDGGTRAGATIRRGLWTADAHRLAEAAGKVGVVTCLRVFPRLWHVFQLSSGSLPEANQALREVAHATRQALP